jgi:hypothetical protein
MRDFAKLLPQFWIGATGRKLHKGCPEATVVAVYLISGPQSNMLGLYYLPKMYIAHETGLGVEGAAKGLQRAIEAGFCQYDDESETVFIPEMARFQIAERLEPKDNRCRWVQRAYDALPENPFLGTFYEKYASAFHLKKSRAKAIETLSPSEAPSKPIRSQEQEQEQEQEKDFEQEIRERAGEGRRSPRERETVSENQNQNLSDRRKEQTQHQKLLHGEIKLYEEQHGRKPDDVAFGIICQKNHIPFEYGKMLLEQSVGP